MTQIYYKPEAGPDLFPLDIQILISQNDAWLSTLTKLPKPSSGGETMGYLTPPLQSLVTSGSIQ